MYVFCYEGIGSNDFTYYAPEGTPPAARATLFITINSPQIPYGTILNNLAVDKFVINNINNKTHLLIPKMYKLAVREVALWIIPDCTFYTIRREGVEKLSEDISNDGLDYTIRHKPIPEGYFDEKSI